MRSKWLSILLYMAYPESPTKDAFNILSSKESTQTVVLPTALVYLWAAIINFLGLATFSGAFLYASSNF